MKKLIIIASIVALVMCWTSNGCRSADKEESREIKETFRPPLEGEVVLNPDGTYTVIEKKSPRPWGWLVISGALVVAALAARHYIKK